MKKLLKKLLTPEDKKETFYRKAIHCENGQWYFWDETWADRLGPYPTKKTCYEALEDYGRFLNDGPPGEV